jgi:hypothetical protein
MALMRRSFTLSLLLSASLVLAGCSSLKRFSGALDDTVLPGERESILPPENYSGDKSAMDAGSDTTTGADTTAADPDTTMQDAQPECDPAKDKDCPPPADDGGIFNDG